MKSFYVSFRIPASSIMIWVKAWNHWTESNCQNLIQTPKSSCYNARILKQFKFFVFVFFPLGNNRVESLWHLIFWLFCLPSFSFYYVFYILHITLLFFKIYFSFLFVSVLYYNENNIYKKKSIKVEKYFLVMIVACG